MGRVWGKTSDVSVFWYWINERHQIYLRRASGQPKPWTEDTILRDYKFTNPFRELDRGTQHWHRVRDAHADAPLHVLLFNLITYRMYNRDTAQQNLGWLNRWGKREKAKWLALPKPVFTGAHMTVGCPGEDKTVTYARTWDHLWMEIKTLCEYLQECRTMEDAFKTLLVQRYFGIGKFIAYEIICDLRFTPIGEHWEDTETWANIGPGCARGLKRLGMPVRLASLQELYQDAGEWLDDVLIPHHTAIARENGWQPDRPYFELREIEHSLCEFDKYERTRLGEGRPRSKYQGAG